MNKKINIVAEAKVCSKCKQEKNINKFYKKKINKDGLTYECNECHKKYYKTYYLKNKEEINIKRKPYFIEYAKLNKNKKRKYNKNYHLKRRYGISAIQFEELLKKQNYKCSICKTNLNNIKQCVDHCHTTEQIRGILCDNCNVGLGKFKDNEAIMLNALQYIKSRGDINE